MTSLRTFQHEIDDIHNRELNKQRLQGAATMVKEKTTKETQKGKGKGKAEPVAPVVVDEEPFSNVDLAEVEEKLIVCLTSLRVYVSLMIHGVDPTAFQAPCRL